MKDKIGFVANKAVSDVQVTADQLVKDAYSDYATQEKRKRMKLQMSLDSSMSMSTDEASIYKAKTREGFETSIRNNRFNLATYVRYAEWEASLGEFRRARSAFERGLEVNYQDVSYWIRYISMEEGLGDCDHVMSLFSRVTYLLPGVGDVWLRWIAVSRVIGSRDDVYRVLNEWISKCPSRTSFLAYFVFLTEWSKSDSFTSEVVMVGGETRAAKGDSVASGVSHTTLPELLDMWVLWCKQSFTKLGEYFLNSLEPRYLQVTSSFPDGSGEAKQAASQILSESLACGASVLASILQSGYLVSALLSLLKIVAAGDAPAEHRSDSSASAFAERLIQLASENKQSLTDASGLKALVELSAALRRNGASRGSEVSGEAAVGEPILLATRAGSKHAHTAPRLPEIRRELWKSDYATALGALVRAVDECTCYTSEVGQFSRAPNSEMEALVNALLDLVPSSDALLPDSCSVYDMVIVEVLADDVVDLLALGSTEQIKRNGRYDDKVSCGWIQLRNQLGWLCPSKLLDRLFDLTSVSKADYIAASIVPFAKDVAAVMQSLVPRNSSQVSDTCRAGSEPLACWSVVRPRVVAALELGVKFEAETKASAQGCRIFLAQAIKILGRYFPSPFILLARVEFEFGEAKRAAEVLRVAVNHFKSSVSPAIDQSIGVEYLHDLVIGVCELAISHGIESVVFDQLVQSLIGAMMSLINVLPPSAESAAYARRRHSRIASMVSLLLTSQFRTAHQSAGYESALAGLKSSVKTMWGESDQWALSDKSMALSDKSVALPDKSMAHIVQSSVVAAMNLLVSEFESYTGSMSDRTDLARLSDLVPSKSLSRWALPEAWTESATRVAETVADSSSADTQTGEVSAKRNKLLEAAKRFKAQSSQGDDG